LSIIVDAVVIKKNVVENIIKMLYENISSVNMISFKLLQEKKKFIATLLVKVYLKI